MTVAEPAHRRCMVCGSIENLRHVAIRVDRQELLLQPDLCPDHSDVYLLHLGRVLGVLVKNGKLQDPVDLVRYCLEYSFDIFVRSDAGDNHRLADMPARELLRCLERWLLNGHTPVRVVRDQEPQL